jgi:hypothetical protein
MERELPTINLEGTDFVVDVTKFELTEKANPSNIIVFEDMRDVGDGYTFQFSKQDKNLPAAFNAESVAVTIPEFVKMDPVGMANRYNVSDITGKTDFDLMVDQEAFNKRVNQGMLPILNIEGHPFYVDLRMDMLRPHDDFGSRGIVFDEIQNYFSEEMNAYVIPYNPKTHEFQELDYDNITEFPKDLIAVQFPFQKELDPVGWNRTLGLDIKEDLKHINLKSHFEAQTVPWEKTGLEEVIKDNLKRQYKLGKMKKPEIKPVAPKGQKSKGRKM